MIAGEKWSETASKGLGNRWSQSRSAAEWERTDRARAFLGKVGAPILPPSQEQDSWEYWCLSGDSHELRMGQDMDLQVMTETGFSEGNETDMAAEKLSMRMGATSEAAPRKRGQAMAELFSSPSFAAEQLPW